MDLHQWYEEYHPFGSTAWHAEDNTLADTVKRYRYTGKEKDDETGLYYHGARFYACWLGRWCSADPIGLGDGPNRYAYVRNNPVGATDPTGMYTDTDGREGTDYAPGTPSPGEIEVRDKTFWEKPGGKVLAGLAGLAVGAATSIAFVAGAAALVAAAPVAGAALVGGVALLGIGALLYGVITDDDLGYKVERLFTGEASASEYFGAGFFVGGFAGGSPAAKSAVQAGTKAGIGARLLYEVAVTDLGSTSAAAANKFAAGEVAAGVASTGGLSIASPVKPPPPVVPAPPPPPPNIASKGVASPWAPAKNANQLWSKGKKGIHFRDHGEEVGAATMNEYSSAASAFGSKENSGQFLDLTVSGFLYRFEPATNKVFVGTIAGRKVKTFYKWDGRPNDVVVMALQEAGKL